MDCRGVLQFWSLHTSLNGSFRILTTGEGATNKAVHDKNNYKFIQRLQWSAVPVGLSEQISGRKGRIKVWEAWRNEQTNQPKNKSPTVLQDFVPSGTAALKLELGPTPNRLGFGSTGWELNQQAVIWAKSPQEGRDQTDGCNDSAPCSTGHRPLGAVVQKGRLEPYLMVDRLPWR